MFEDDALTDKSVETRMFGSVEPDEVIRAVVKLVAVQMMTDLVGFGNTPERRTNELMNVSLFADFNMRIGAPMRAGMRSIRRTELCCQNLALCITDIAVRVGVISLAVNELRRNDFDDCNCHNPPIRRDVGELTARTCRFRIGGAKLQEFMSRFEDVLSRKCPANVTCVTKVSLSLFSVLSIHVFSQRIRVDNPSKALS